MKGSADNKFLSTSPSVCTSACRYCVCDWENGRRKAWFPYIKRWKTFRLDNFLPYCLFICSMSSGGFGSLSRELRTASSRGRYGERRQRDPCLKHTYKNTTCWPATAYDVTTGANHSIKGRRENTSSSSSSSMTVLFEACIVLVRTNFYCYYGEH